MPAQETGTMTIVPAHFRSLEGPGHNLIATIAFFTMLFLHIIYTSIIFCMFCFLN